MVCRLNTLFKYVEAPHSVLDTDPTTCYSEKGNVRAEIWFVFL